MARCPRCTKHFRVMEDEENMHPCPSCGYAPWNESACLWCSRPYDPDTWDADSDPYCSLACDIAAERDSEEDNAS